MSTIELITNGSNFYTSFCLFRKFYSTLGSTKIRQFDPFTEWALMLLFPRKKNKKKVYAYI